MAVLWRRTIGGLGYEVRGAGRTRRFLVGGVLHSAWNPSSALTGAVWDPIALAGVLARGGRPRTVLLLGLGGGGAVRLLRRHLAPRRIVAVERDAARIAVARRFFGVRGDDVEVVHADALPWVAAAGRLRFDVVVDDLFGEADGEPVRAAGGRAWWGRLAAMTTRRGVLVVNFASPRELRSAALERHRLLRRRFPSAAVFACEGYTNRIAALAGSPGAAALFRERLAALPTIPRSRRAGPRFRVAPLW